MEWGQTALKKERGGHWGGSSRRMGLHTLTVTWLGPAAWSSEIALPVTVCDSFCGRARKSKKVLQEEVVIAPEIVFVVLLQSPYRDTSLAADTSTCSELRALQR